MVDGPYPEIEVPKGSDSISNGREANGHSPSFSDVWLQNERAMWWAEFDGVGEEAVHSNIERNSYPATGMEVARQWLAQRESPQLRGDVQPIRTLAENVQETSSESLRSASEELTLASRVDANSRAIVEIAANAKKNARTMILVGMVASVCSLCAIVMVLASSRQVAPNTKQASPQPSRPKHAVVRLPRPTVPPAEIRQASRPKQAVARPLRPAVPPTEIGQTSRPKQAVARPLLPTVPPAEIRQASAIPPENAQTKEPSDEPQIKSLDLEPQGQSLAEALALIADKVSGEGAINFTAQFHDMAMGRDYTEQLSYKTSNVTIDPNRCQVGYHWHVERDGIAVSDQDRTVDLRLAKSISVTSIDVEPGGRFSVRAYPKVYVVHIARWNNASGDDLYFRDRDVAARVGTASRRAVELCDNGEQQFRPR